MSLSMNELEPCGTRSARKRHLAHGQLCLKCDPDTQRLVYCRACRQRVTAVGEVVQPHLMASEVPCLGEGRRVSLPQPVDVPIWVQPAGLNRKRVIALASIRSGAA